MSNERKTYSIGELFSGMDHDGNLIGMKERARSLVDRSLNYRVEGREWETAQEVGRFFLKICDEARMIPLSEAVKVVVSQQKRLGYAVIRKEPIDRVLKAAKEYGLDKDHATDSPKLKELKLALRELQFADTM